MSQLNPTRLQNFLRSTLPVAGMVVAARWFSDDPAIALLAIWMIAILPLFALADNVANHYRDLQNNQLNKMRTAELRESNSKRILARQIKISQLAAMEEGEPRTNSVEQPINPTMNTQQARATIEEGDTVHVNFQNAQVTLCESATVLYKPQAAGDSWIFKDDETGFVHHVSEGCTVSKRLVV